MPLALAIAAVLTALFSVADAAVAVAESVATQHNTADGLGDVGLVQLQLQVHGTSDRRQPEAAGASPGHVGLCVVQDNRCFEKQLEVHQPPVADVPPDGFAQIVVTRAGEDVRWLDALPEIPALVYDRGGSPTLLPQARSNLRVVQQANTGREDDEMLRHVADNYDNLPNITVFLQGWPLLHCAGVVDTVRNVVRSLREPGGFARLGNGAMEGLVPLSRTFYEYSEPEGLVGYARAMAEAHESGDDIMERAVSLYAKTCRSILGRPCPERHWVAEGAQWAVSRERIRSQPLDVYRRALDIGEGYQGKLRGLVLEAIWPLLWGADGWTPSPKNSTSPSGVEAPEVISLLGLGRGAVSAALPDEEWCRRWSWTWVCESVGLPASQHRRRRRRAGMLYGSYSRNSMRSAEAHCAAPNGNDALMWSCEDRMAFCELQRLSEEAQGPPSQSMLQQRPRFHTSADGTLLEMLVRLCAALLPGARNCVKAEDVGLGLSLQEQGLDKLVGTQWYLSGMAVAAGSVAPGVLGGRNVSLSTTSPHSITHYLACDPASDEARLSTSREPWQLLAAPDGLIRMKASDGRFLQLSAGPSHRLVCAQGEQGDQSVFALQLQAHAPPEALAQSKL